MNMPAAAYVIGLDSGTDSVRALLVNAISGEEIADAGFLFPRWKEKKYCNALVNRYRQHPLDYVEGIEAVISSCLQ